MDKFNMIRSGIFLVAGLVTIIFRARLNKFKNKLLVRFKFKPRDEEKAYIPLGIVFLVISLVLFVYSVLG
ncbi:hypothetical protein ACFL0W_05500, partial [Nanoarchaeota archaeon]